MKNYWLVGVRCGLPLLFLLWLVAACMNGGGDLAGKWQLRTYSYPDGAVLHEDSVFYNFQKGSFSAICLRKDGDYTVFFGNYSLTGDEISIILLPESVHYELYGRYIGWPDGKQTFKVEELSSSALRLESGGVRLNFRKY